MASKTILVLTAHNDDHIAGAGGALIKLARLGYTIKTVVFSFDESAQPHYLPEVIAERRGIESRRTDRIIGGRGVTFLCLADTRLRDESVRRSALKRLSLIIQREAPARVFTHSPSDMHPEHRAVLSAVRHLREAGIITCPVLCFDFWLPAGIRTRDRPRILIDVTDAFTTKLKAIHSLRTRPIGRVARLVFSVVRAGVAGWRSGSSILAEEFVLL